MFTYLKNNKNKSFSILEVLVAITVITVGLVGVVGLVLRNLSIAKVSPERVIAVNLAQEGIEILHNIRDTNLLLGRDFDTNIGKQGNERFGSTVEPDGTINHFSMPIYANVWECKDDGNCQLYFDDGLYTHISSATAVETGFYRFIKLDKISNDEIKVVSQVSWHDTQGTQHTINLERRLYDYEMSPNPQKLYHWEYAGTSSSRGDCSKAFCDIDGFYTCGTDTTLITGGWDLVGRDLWCGFVTNPSGCTILDFSECKLHGSHAFHSDPDCLYDAYTATNNQPYRIYVKVLNK